MAHKYIERLVLRLDLDILEPVGQISTTHAFVVFVHWMALVMVAGD